MYSPPLITQLSSLDMCVWGMNRGALKSQSGTCFLIILCSTLLFVPSALGEEDTGFILSLVSSGWRWCWGVSAEGEGTEQSLCECWPGSRARQDGVHRHADLRLCAGFARHPRCHGGHVTAQLEGERGCWFEHHHGHLADAGSVDGLHLVQHWHVQLYA